MEFRRFGSGLLCVSRGPFRQVREGVLGFCDGRSDDGGTSTVLHQVGEFLSDHRVDVVGFSVEKWYLTAPHGQRFAWCGLQRFRVDGHRVRSLDTGVDPAWVPYLRYGSGSASSPGPFEVGLGEYPGRAVVQRGRQQDHRHLEPAEPIERSEERRVGKEGRCRWAWAECENTRNE